MPPLVGFALAEALLLSRRFGRALGILLGLHCVLRTGELLPPPFASLLRHITAAALHRQRFYIGGLRWHQRYHGR